MEKRTMTYDLEAIKQAFHTVKKLRVTVTALKDARSMGFTSQDMVDPATETEGFRQIDDNTCKSSYLAGCL